MITTNRELELKLLSQTTIITKSCCLRLHQSSTALKRQCGLIHVATKAHNRLQHFEIKLLHTFTHPLSRNLETTRTVPLTTSKMYSTSTIALLFQREKSVHSQTHLVVIHVPLMPLLKSVKTSSRTIFFISNRRATMTNIQQVIRCGIHGR